MGKLSRLLMLLYQVNRHHVGPNGRGPNPKRGGGRLVRKPHNPRLLGAAAVAHESVEPRTSWTLDEFGSVRQFDRDLERIDAPR